MLNKLTIRNFKRFGQVEVELGSPVVLVGPNNSGKTSALQALALWQLGVRKWNEKRAGKQAPEKRPGVTINRRDLIAAPVPNANLLWRNLRVREGDPNGQRRTKNVRIDIVVDGQVANEAWCCGLEFDYANEESFYCRPLRIGENGTDRMPVPDAAAQVEVAFLPPMSGLAPNETRLDKGAVDVRIGEGRTAEVLRNLCHRIFEERPVSWLEMAAYIEKLFGAELNEPRYIAERGEISMGYREHGVALDLSCSGKGLQQTLLLLAYLYANPGSVLLLDEPDAHLEIIRQRQIYNLLTSVAGKNGSQIVAASHSEVVLNEAAGKDLVVAFVGRPHRIGDRGSQVTKALAEIGYDQYYQAEHKGWVLYLEGSTDLAILKALAERMGHAEAIEALETPFVHYVGNDPNAVRKHYHGLREAVPRLEGIAIFDRLDRPLPDNLGATGLTWRKREIENYLCFPATLEAHARSEVEETAFGPLFAQGEVDRRIRVMKEAIEEISSALQKLGKGSPWEGDLKVSDEFLGPLYRAYYLRLGLPNPMAKKNFYDLAQFVPMEQLDPEVAEKLDAIVAMAKGSIPSREES